MNRIVTIDELARTVAQFNSCHESDALAFVPGWNVSSISGGNSIRCPDTLSVTTCSRCFTGSKAYKRQLLERWEELPPVFVTSSEKGVGREELLGYIDELNNLPVCTSSVCRGQPCFSEHIRIPADRLYTSCCLSENG